MIAHKMQISFYKYPYSKHKKRASTVSTHALQWTTHAICDHNDVMIHRIVHVWIRRIRANREGARTRGREDVSARGQGRGERGVVTLSVVFSGVCSSASSSSSSSRVLRENNPETTRTTQKRHVQPRNDKYNPETTRTTQKRLEQPRNDTYNHETTCTT